MAASAPRVYRGYRLVPRYSTAYPPPRRPYVWDVFRPDGSPVGPHGPDRPGFPTLDAAQRAVRRDLGIENEGDRRRWARHPALSGVRLFVATER